MTGHFRDNFIHLYQVFYRVSYNGPHAGCADCRSGFAIWAAVTCPLSSERDLIIPVSTQGRIQGGGGASGAEAPNRLKTAPSAAFGG